MLTTSVHCSDPSQFCQSIGASPAFQEYLEELAENSVFHLPIDALQSPAPSEAGTPNDYVTLCRLSRGIQVRQKPRKEPRQIDRDKTQGCLEVSLGE